MRRIFTVSIDTELENEIENYLKVKGIETKSEGAIQLLKKGLRYEEDASKLKSEIQRLSEVLRFRLRSDNKSMEKHVYRGRVKGGGVFNLLPIPEVTIR